MKKGKSKTRRARNARRKARQQTKGYDHRQYDGSRGPADNA